MKALTLACLAAAVTLSGCQTTAPDTHDADVKAITTLESNWAAAYKAHDMDKLSTIYADNAAVMMPNMQRITGKDAILAADHQMFADPALELTFHSDRVEVAKSGDVAWSQGTYHLTVTNPATHQPIHDHGNYVTTFQKQSDGNWKAVADIATSEVPPPAPAAPETKPSRKH